MLYHLDIRTFLNSTHKVVYQHIGYQNIKYKMRFYLQNFLFLLYCVPHRFSLIGLLCIINGSHCVLALLCFINDNLNTISAYRIPSLPSLVPLPPSTYRIPSLPSLVPLLSFLILIAYPHYLLLSPPLLSLLILIAYPHSLLLSPSPFYPS